jgi:hypothetical protein
MSPHTVHVLSKHEEAEIIMMPHTVHVLSKHEEAEIIMMPTLCMCCLNMWL